MERSGDDDIVLSRPDLRAMLTRAAHDGARQALADVGLGDGEAGEDVRDLRDLMKTWRAAKATAFKAIVQQVTNALFIALLIGLAISLGFNIRH